MGRGGIFSFFSMGHYFGFNSRHFKHRNIFVSTSLRAGTVVDGLPRASRSNPRRPARVKVSSFNV